MSFITLSQEVDAGHLMPLLVVEPSTLIYFGCTVIQYISIRESFGNVLILISVYKL